MKDTILNLLPPQQREQKNKDEKEIAEKFFVESEELRNAIKATEEKGIYFISDSTLKKIDCPIKRKNGKNYWEAFFLFLGFEFAKSPRVGGAKLIIR